MKKTLLVALSVMSLSAIADIRNPGPGPVGPGSPGGNRDDLVMCLKNLDNANRRYDNLQNQLNDVLRRCNQPGPVNPGAQREIEQLRSENARLNGTVSSLQSINDRLTLDNQRLQNENFDLRRQLDDIRNGGNRALGFFSYAGCKDFAGNVDLKYIAGAEGRVGLESETNALQKVASSFSCRYGIATAATEEIRTTQSVNYCVAGCKDFSGNVDQKYIQSGVGRNVTEASFNAIKAVSANYSCNYGIKIQACQ